MTGVPNCAGLMSPAELREYLTVLADAGVARATLPGGVSVEFAPPDPGAVPVTPFVDKDGKPVDLDKDMPWNAADMDEDGDPVFEKNFNRDKQAE